MDNGERRFSERRCSKQTRAGARDGILTGPDFDGMSWRVLIDAKVRTSDSHALALGPA
jgi:hypothetical protein